jgi:hypothetical protein
MVTFVKRTRKAYADEASHAECSELNKFQWSKAVRNKGGFIPDYSTAVVNRPKYDQ